MLDLSKFCLNNFYLSFGNIPMPTFSMPNFSLFDSFNCFPSFKINYVYNAPIFPNFLNFNYGNFYFPRPIYSVFNYNNLFDKPDNREIKPENKEIKSENREIEPENKRIIRDSSSKPKINNDKKIDNSYVTLSQKQAEEKAQNDENLELLKGGTNWSVSTKSFRTDIPYAKKGTGKILDKVSSMIGEQLVITSALGTGDPKNPHKKGGYSSHHNAENPKLDIRISGNGRELARKLKSTGYFSRISIEKDHLDVQIDSSKYKEFEAVA